MNLFEAEIGQFLVFALSLLAVFFIFLLMRMLAVTWVVRRYGGELSGAKYHSLEEMVQRQAKKTHIKMPQIRILPDYSANAMTLQRVWGRPIIVFSEGLLQELDHKQLEAMIYLCIAQIKLKEFRFSTLASIISLPWAALIKYLPESFRYLFQPLISLIVGIFLGRARIFRADSMASSWTCDAPALATALHKLAAVNRRLPAKDYNLALNHLFLVSAIPEDSLSFAIHETHPSLQERIDRILQAETC